MKHQKIGLVALVVGVSGILAHAQVPSANSAAVQQTAPLQAAAPEQTAPAQPGSPKIVLEDGTPVRLRFGRVVSSAEVIAGETVDFQVTEEVRVGDLVVIPKDSPAWATITMAQAKRRMARGGNLNMKIDNVRLASGERAPLRMIKEEKGGGHTGAMVGGMVVTSVVFFPAAPFFLFMHGKDVVIPKGTEVTSYVHGDFSVDPSKFPGARIAALPAPASGPLQTRLQINSTPAGAAVEVDGKSVGVTPASLVVSQGEHVIGIIMTGHSRWERKIAVSGATQEVNAELQTTP